MLTFPLPHVECSGIAVVCFWMYVPVTSSDSSAGSNQLVRLTTGRYGGNVAMC